MQLTRPAGLPRAGLESSRLGTASVWLGAVVVAVAAGAGLAEGGFYWLVVGVAVGAALFPVLAQSAFGLLLGWLAVTAAAYPFVRIPPYVTLDRILVLALVAGLLLKARPLARSGPTRLLTFAVWWLLLAFGIRAAVDGVSAMQTWTDAILLPAILFLLTSRLAVTEKRCQQVGAALTVAGATLGGIGVAGKVLGFELASRTGGELRVTSEQGGGTVTRISGPYAVPEVYAVALIICLAGTLYWILSRPTSGRVLWGGTAASLMGIALALTLFRAGWIAAIIVVIAAFGLRPQRFGRVFGVTAAIGCLALAGTTQLQQNQTFETRFRNTDNVQSRVATYIEATHIFASEPLFGVGVNRYPKAAPSFETVTFGGVAAIPFPHSSYFGMLAEQGLFGFLPFIALTIAVWYLLRAMRRRARTQNDVVLVAATVGAALGYLLMSLTLTMLPYGQSNAFFAVLLGMVAARLDASEAPETKEAAP